jgi:hypothetical protein
MKLYFRDEAERESIFVLFILLWNIRVITTEAIACNRNTPGETVRQSRAGSDCMGEQPGSLGEQPGRLGEQPGRLGEQQALACDQPSFSL